MSELHGESQEKLPQKIDIVLSTLNKEMNDLIAISLFHIIKISSCSEDVFQICKCDPFSKSGRT